MTSFRSAGDTAWDYVRIPEALKPYVSWELRSPGIYELIVLDGLPSKVASNRPDGSYATEDLFTPHLSIQNAWKYFARLDDTIELMNGEKFTPIAFEQSIRDNKLVKEAVIFGSGKARVGMIIIPSDAAGNLSSEAIKTLLAPVIVKGNHEMPSYAQLSLDMAEVMPTGTDYPRTDKGTVIRAAFYRTFEAQIEAIYEAAEVSSGELCLSEAELRKYIRQELARIIPPPTYQVLGDDTDLFSIGVDSLQTIQLRSVIAKNIRTNANKLSSNIVFEFLTIDSLAQELYRLRTGGSASCISWATATLSVPAPRLIVVAGPCGAGKSSLAKAVSAAYGIPWVEGDQIHSKESVAKMASGISLSDDDRWLWLETVKATALVELSRAKTSDIVVTCSALKRSYRDELRGSRVLRTVFLMLQSSPEILHARCG